MYKKKYVHLYYGLAFIFQHVNQKSYQLHPFVNSTLSSPKKVHGHSHSKPGSSIYIHVGYLPCKHPALSIM